MAAVSCGHRRHMRSCRHDLCAFYPSRLILPTFLLFLGLGCSDKSKGVAPEDLPSPFTTEVMTDSWLALQTTEGATIMHPDGSEATRFDGVGVGRWSPHATWLTLYDEANGLRAYGPESGEMISLPMHSSIWSPDASQVLFPSEGIRVHDIASGEQHFIGHGNALDWSADGKWIAVALPPKYIDGPFSIHLIPADGSGDVVTIGQGIAFRDCISADSRWVVYGTGNVHVGFRMRAVSIDGKSDLLLHTSRDQSGPSWAPVGTNLVFGSSDYMLRVESPDHHGRHMPKGMWPKWSPDGKQIAYFVDEWSFTGKALRAIDLEHDDRHIAWDPRSWSWSPDSQMLAVDLLDDRQSSRGSRGIYLIDAATGDSIRVADGDGVLWSPPRQ